jgi:hypothetical protein
MHVDLYPQIGLSSRKGVLRLPSCAIDSSARDSGAKMPEASSRWEARVLPALLSHSTSWAVVAAAAALLFTAIILMSLEPV